MQGKPICFVIMGFGVKTDYGSKKTLNLDQTYKNIIKPSAEAAGFRCVRGDEIQDSGLIDKSMYALLLRAELVIADISTFNPNALYELGVRHAARPFSTIIIKSGGDKIPFDIDHTRIFPYKHLGDDIGADEAARCVHELTQLIEAVKQDPKADSPIYEHLHDLQPLNLTDEEYENIIAGLKNREDSIFALTENALLDMKKNDFTTAAAKWQKAAEIADSEPYFVQQQALATYKSKSPSAMMALTNALGIINQLDPDATNDPETLGIAGAIYKNFFLETNDPEMIEKAIEFYRKGLTVADDYYTGENYVTCLERMEDITNDVDQKTYYRIAADKARTEVIRIIKAIDVDDLQTRHDEKWVYATKANMLRALGNDLEADEAETKFRSLTDIDWEIGTFEGTKKHIMDRRTG
jgi:tetratricopeptide (TPR) repeat protein